MLLSNFSQDGISQNIWHLFVAKISISRTAQGAEISIFKQICTYRIT